MADNYSFDVVSRIDMQEMKNVVDQTLKEVGQRFDFKGSKTELTLKEKDKQLVVISDDEYKLNAVLDILKAKCVKRNVSLKGLTYGKVEEALGGTVRQTITIQSGLPDDKAKAITKSIKEGQIQSPGANSRGTSQGTKQKQRRTASRHEASQRAGFWTRPAIRKLPIRADRPDSLP